MDAENSLLIMFRELSKHDVLASEQFFDDIKRLVKTDINKFIEAFTRDLMRSNLKEYKKYERLKLTKAQNKRLNGNALFRYEYRNNSNLRCIYMVRNVNNDNETYLLCAFNEDGGKKTGKNSYNFNIERAIKIYESK